MVGKRASSVTSNPACVYHFLGSGRPSSEFCLLRPMDHLFVVLTANCTQYKTTFEKVIFAILAMIVYLCRLMHNTIDVHAAAGHASAGKRSSKSLSA